MNFIFVMLAAAWASSGASPGCKFVARQAAPDLMRDLGEEVIGLTSCYEKSPHLSSLIVARMRTLEGRALHDFLLRLAKQWVPDAVETVIVGEDVKTPGAHQIMIRSKRNNGKYDWHYAFTARGRSDHFVFVHSANHQDTLGQEKSLQEVRGLLSRSEFIAQLEGFK